MNRSEAARVAAYARAEALSPERRSEIARLGGLAMLARLGKDGLAERVAKWRRQHPSALVRAVMEWLGAEGLECGRDYRLDEPVLGWYGDIVLKGKRRIVEVDGRAWHHADWHGELDKRAERDQAKLATWESGKRKVLVLDEAEIRDGSARERLRRFIEE